MKATRALPSTTESSHGAGSLSGGAGSDGVRLLAESPDGKGAASEIKPTPQAQVEGRIRVFDVQGRPATTAFIEFAGAPDLESSVEPVPGSGHWQGELAPEVQRVRALPPRWAQRQGPGPWLDIQRKGTEPVELTLTLQNAQGTTIQGELLHQYRYGQGGTELRLVDRSSLQAQSTATDDWGFSNLLVCRSASTASNSRRAPMMMAPSFSW